MEKVKLKLNGDEWRELAGLVLGICATRRDSRGSDKYMEAIFDPLLKQVYVKLHNKLHSLQERKNVLTLSFPEAGVLGLLLGKVDSENYLIYEIVGVIDQKIS